MNTNYIAVFLFITTFLPELCLGQDFNVELYSHQTQGGHTNIWYVSSGKLKKLPAWKMGEEPPLSLSKAVGIARLAVAGSQNEGNIWVQEIKVCPVFPGSKEYGGIYFYNICFGGVGYVGHYGRCIVLMDGTIVKPDWLGERPKVIGPWSYDE